MSLANEGRAPREEEEEQDFRPEQVCELCARNVAHKVIDCGAFGTKTKDLTPGEKVRKEEEDVKKAEEQLKQEREAFAARVCWKKK